jgi:hypothetical protein
VPADDVEAFAEAKPGPVAVVSAYITMARSLAAKALARIDPNDDEDAEPLGLVPLITLGVALTYSLWMFWHWKFQPMQDLGHHVGLSAVVADFGRPGSLYPALYEKPDPLNANSLLYFFAGYLGKMIGVSNAVRVGMSFYLAGVPLANLYALRVFGRSPWGAVLTVPLAYNMNFVGGFANLLFAAPFMVLTMPVFYRTLVAPTWKRIVASAFLFVAVFLSHAHAFLWVGVLSFTLTLAFFVLALVTRGLSIKERLRAGAKVAGAALVSVIPAMLLFYRWYQWSFGKGKAEGSVQTLTSGFDNHFGAAFKTPAALFTDLWNYALKIFVDETDLILVYKIGILIMVAVAFSRLHKWRRPVVMEMAFTLTVASYFFMPEAIDSNPVVGSRQIGVALWFIGAMVSPVPASVSRLARWIVIAGILYCTREYLRAWHDHMVTFENTEANGIEYVLDQTPYRQRMHYVKVSSDFSKVFTWKPNWHVEKFYMADRFGQVPDNPAIVSTSSIRYKAGVDPHRITYHGPDWASWADLWSYHELVLVHGWEPTDKQLEEAKSHAVRIRKEGSWELWRKKGDWQEKGDGAPPNVR